MTFNIKVKEDLLCDVSDINGPVERAIQKFKNHPNIQMIKEIFDSNKTFSVDLVSSGRKRGRECLIYSGLQKLRARLRPWTLWIARNVHQNGVTRARKFV